MEQKEKTISFNELGINKNFLDCLSKKGFKIPTPIQHKIIPSALKGKDMVGIAQTGTGKTFAFGLPMLQNLINTNNQGLVLLPTRELAIQVEQELNKIGAKFGLRLAVIIGGASQNPQIKALRRKPHVIIATPGRLADLMKQGECKLHHVNIVTLDEADRMLDVGFLPEIKRILKTVRKDRQTMLFSATMPKSISMLITEFMKTPVRVEIAPQGTSSENIEQEIFFVPKNNKMRLLDAVLEEYKQEKVLIFSRTKFGAKRMARDIRGMGHTATEIHSNRSQNQRQTALAGFKKGMFRVMVATDIAARGIDVKDIGLVINFDLPENSEDYVHRIGRTGRAGKTGKAISFVMPSQNFDVKKIQRLIRKTLPVSKLPQLPPERKNSLKTNNNYDKPQNTGSAQRRYQSKRNYRGKSKPFKSYKRTGNHKAKTNLKRRSN